MSNINVNDWTRVYGTFKADPTKQVEYVDIELHADDAVCRDTNNVDTPIYFTDLQFQPGEQLTGWIPNEQEMLDALLHNSDENVNTATPNTMPTILPTVYTGLETRMFNIVGRGHSVITIPNYYPQDWSKEILPSGIDFTIYPKEDFDLCRISTNVGALRPEEEWYNGDLVTDFPNSDAKDWLGEKHPLSQRYTREFWIDGAPAGTEIKIHASTRIAQVGGVNQTIAGERTFDASGWPFKIGRKRFMLLPRGSIRFRIEFYKHINWFPDPANEWQSFLVFKDTGIGFHGTAEFRQWTYGGERI